MIAQAYFDKSDTSIVRLFIRSLFVADLPLRDVSESGADAALKPLRLQRRSAWTKTSWGRQATVCFVGAKRKAAKP
jgi:hypothetical protein